MTKEQRPSTASRAGYHFLSSYQSCRWKWYYRNILKLVPLKTSRYLLFGQAVHGAMEAYYNYEVGNPEEMLQVGLDWLRSLHDQYEKLEHYNDDFDKMQAMIKKWYATYGITDMANYDILAVEVEMIIPLPGGFNMTVRPDVAVQDKNNKSIYLLEHKTTSRSIHEMAHSVSCQAQVDAQILGLQQWCKANDKDPSYIGGVIPNIMYKRQSVCQAERTPVINRTRKELADTQLSFAGLFSEIGQKVASLEAGTMPPEALFDRNGSWCAQFGCEYESICKSRFTGAPPGFKKEEQ